MTRSAALAALLVLGACAAPPFDLAALERRHPALVRLPGHRLGDVTPYVLPRRDELLWFLCRWDEREPLRVALPEDATPRERELLELALASWEAARLGVAFTTVGARDPAEIVFEVAPEAGRRAGGTRAECGVVVHDGGIRARLVVAAVVLARTQPDSLGREVPLSEAEWLGGAVHELGHALGFQGHARGGAGPMVREVEVVRRIGHHLLDGSPLRADTLRALYALPSGTIVARRPLVSGTTRGIDRLDDLARERGYRGPLVRVGDHAARIAWWNAEGRSVGVRLPAIRETLADPRRLAIEPDLLARAWLGPGS